MGVYAIDMAHGAAKNPVRGWKEEMVMMAHQAGPMNHTKTPPWFVRWFIVHAGLDIRPIPLELLMLAEQFRDERANEPLGCFGVIDRGGIA